MNEKTTRILLVEDNLGDVRLLQEYLKESDSLNADLIHVDCLSEAVACLGEAASYDLVLLDLSLPDSQGLATFSAIQERAGNLPIILLTGNDDESLAVQAVQQGAQDYLVKGKVDADLLARAIRYGIERNQLLVEMEKVREVEQHLAYHDMLTNLPNRLLFYDRMRQALAHARRYSGLVAVLFLDLDGFKAINDRHGHAVGDRLLQAVATRLKGNMRQSDTIARLGGDEFTILLTGIKSMKDVSRTAQKVLSVVSRPFAIDGHQLGVTCSIGVSVFPHDGSDTESLIKRADFAMYRAKNQGKANYQHFDITVVSQAPKQASFENDLRKAIVNHELRIHFQPQVSLATGQITGVEALVRWQHPEFGLLPPSEFIPLAEETGLIVPLGEWVLRSACIQNKVWQVAGYEPLPVAINLSARQFREIGLPETVARVLHETGLSPNFLMLEITETNAMQDVEYTIATLEVLKDMGLGIALDDFGTGHSSLSYLKRFPIDLLKIDKSFIQDVPDDPDDACIITAIVGLSQNLGMKVIAEGVETEKQLAFLRAIRCEQMQGFFFSRPLPTRRTLELFDSGKRLLPGENELAEVTLV